VLFAQQSETAIAAGAFHNDVVAVANEHVLFVHEQAFADADPLYTDLRDRVPETEIIIVPAERVSLEDAIKSYLFNAQLVTLPEEAGMALILPTEARENDAVWSYLTDLVAGNGPIRRLCPVDVRQSMANGGGPACLRLRVVADPGAVDQRFMATQEKLDQLAEVVAEYWPEAINPDQLSDPGLAKAIAKARNSLLDACGLIELQA
jgi:succinylarginine dihydrolase